MQTIKNIDHLIEKSEEVSRLFEQLSHPVRLQILCLLSESPQSVGVLSEHCKIPQPNMSQFLAKMKKGNLLGSTRKGQTVFYRILDSRIVDLLQTTKTLFC